jgi:hypothetical protein
MKAALAKKLFIKEDHTVLLINLPDAITSEFSHPLASQVKKAPSYDAVFLFVTTQDEIESSLLKSFNARKDDGKFWLAYPKKSGKVDTSLNRDVIWEILTSLSLQPNRMVSINEDWSAIGIIHNSEQKKPSTFGQDPPGVDRATKTVIPPEDLKILLDKNPKANSFFESLAFSYKREYVAWIHGAKKEETRQRRLIKTIELLLDEKKVK